MTDVRIYVSMLAPGLLGALLVVLVLLPQAASTGANVWLARLSSREGGEAALATGVGLYAALCVLAGGLELAKTEFVFRRAVAVASRFHAEALSALLRFPVSFFDSTPPGVVLSRFSNDVGELDNATANHLVVLVDNAMRLASSFLVLAFALPPVVAVTLPVGLAYLRLQKKHVPSAVALVRMRSEAASPVLSLLASTRSGLRIIRAFEAQAHAEATFARHVHASHRANHAASHFNLWLNLRLELLACTLLAGFGISLLFRPALFGDAGLALAVTASVLLTEDFAMLLARLRNFELSMNAVERLRDFAALPKEREGGGAPPAEWPGSNATMIRFRDVILDYGNAERPVLRGIDFSVARGETVGIVGRTGAGKSSLYAALAGLVDLRSGGIEIGGMDTARLSLSAVRSSLTFVPQEPFLLDATLMENVDPSGKRPWSEVEPVLDACGLLQRAGGEAGAKTFRVGVGGRNLSAGERQLACLARALLEDAPILLLDEATANVDPDSERRIQRLLSTALRGRTVLVIAHRLSTVLASDRILVLDSGRVVEDGAPAALLAKPDGAFRRLHDAQRAGLQP